MPSLESDVQPVAFAESLGLVAVLPGLFSLSVAWGGNGPFLLDWMHRLQEGCWVEC